MATESHRYLNSLRSLLDGAATQHAAQSRGELRRDYQVHLARRRLLEAAPQTLARVATELERHGYVVRVGVEETPESSTVGMTIVHVSDPRGADDRVLRAMNATLVFRTSRQGTIKGHVQVPHSGFSFSPGEWEAAEFTADACGAEAVRFVGALCAAPSGPET